MLDPIFMDILKTCIAIEKNAVQLYRKLFDSFESKEVKAFWDDMSNQEVQHATYWKRLLELAKQGSIRNIFGHPELVKKELTNVLYQVKIPISHWPATIDLKTAFLKA